jgi:hypothetical protein
MTELINPIDFNLKRINNHSSNTTRVQNFILGWVFCIITIVVIERYQILNGFRILPGDRYDSVISAAILEHWFNVIRLASNWLDVGYFYPYTRTIAQTDAYFLTGLIYFPIRMMGFDPFLSQEICLIILKIIGFWGAYLFARKIKFGFWHACLLACLFTLANVITTHLARVQLMTVVFCPIILCCLFEFWQGIRNANKIKILIWGGMSGVLYGTWCLTCFYIAWFFIFIFAIFCITSWIMFSRECKKLFISQILECRYQLLAVACIAALSLVPFIYAFFPKSQEVGVRAYAGATDWIFPIWKLWDLGDQNFMYGSLFKELISFFHVDYKSTGEYGNMGYGFFLFGLFLTGSYVFLRMGTDKDNIFFKALIITVFIVIGFTVKVIGHSAWYFVYHLLPGSKALNVISVVNMCLFLPIALIAIEFLRKSNINTLLFILISIMLLLGEINKPYLALDRNMEIEKISNIKTPPHECNVFYVSGWDWQKSSNSATDQFYAHNVTAIMIAQIVKIPTINGIASFSPKDGVFAYPYKNDYDQRIIYYAKNKKIKGLCRLDINDKTWTNAKPVIFLTNISGVFSLEKNTTLFAEQFLKNGWSQPESEFVWMDAQEAHLSLNVGKDFTGILSLDVAAFLPHPDSTQNVSIYIDDKLVSQTKFNTNKNRQRIDIPLKNLEHNTVDIKFVDYDVVSPKAAGISEDVRTLGVQLWGLSVQKEK